MNKFEVELLGEFEDNKQYYTEEAFEKDFTFEIKPVSIVASLDVYDGEIDINFNNGDKIEYSYSCDPTGHMRQDVYEMKINGQSYPVTGDDGFIDEINKVYSEYLKINNN